MIKTLCPTLVLATLLLPPSVYGAEALDPCTLLTQEEAEHLAGTTFSPPQSQPATNPLGQRICLYQSTSGDRLIELSLTDSKAMTKEMRDSGQSAKTIYQDLKQAMAGTSEQPVMGDDAWWGTPGLHILQGEVYLVIAVGNTSKTENHDLARHLAQRILPRL
jgi:hypothetical protein